MQNHFGIGAGGELVAFLNEILAQFEVIEDLTVEDDPERAVGGMQRLRAARDVDDAEAGVSQADLLVHVDPDVVGAAVAQGADHAAKHAPIREGVIETADSGNPAHPVPS